MPPDVVLVYFSVLEIGISVDQLPKPPIFSLSSVHPVPLHEVAQRSSITDRRAGEAGWRQRRITLTLRLGSKHGRAVFLQWHSNARRPRTSITIDLFRDVNELATDTSYSLKVSTTARKIPTNIITFPCLRVGYSSLWLQRKFKSLFTVQWWKQIKCERMESKQKVLAMLWNRNEVFTIVKMEHRNSLMV